MSDINWNYYLEAMPKDRPFLAKLPDYHKDFAGENPYFCNISVVQYHDNLKEELDFYIKHEMAFNNKTNVSEEDYCKIIKNSRGFRLVCYSITPLIGMPDMMFSQSQLERMFAAYKHEQQVREQLGHSRSLLHPIAWANL